MMFPMISAMLATMVWLFYKFWISAYTKWEKKGIRAIPGVFPFGSDPDLITFKRYAGYVYDEMYKQTTLHPYFGVYMVRTSMLVIRDPDIIRNVLSKDFLHFRDRSAIKTSESDVLSQHLFHLDGERWRPLRTKMTPTFSSGKLKAMFPLFIKCSENLNSFLLSKLTSNMDVKDVSSRFTTDIICSCAFGLETNTLESENHELVRIGRSYFGPKPITLLGIALLKAFPMLNGIYPIRYTTRHAENYITKLVADTIEYREKNEIKRNDFLDLMIQFKKQGNVGDYQKGEVQEDYAHPVDMNLGLMAAQCFVFFIAGYETSSSVQSFCLYELAIQQDIQKKLREEIDRVIAKYGGITYEGIKEMEYLDMVVSETMRKYPTLPFLLRTCTKKYSLPAGHIIEKDESVVIPVWSLHHDPQYFPDPDRFDPERFSAENKKKIKPYTYLPFGEGPRVCIGMRFGLLQTKMGLITFLRRFQVLTSEKTTIPLELAASLLVTTVKGSIILKLMPRGQT